MGPTAAGIGKVSTVLAQPCQSHTISGRCENDAYPVASATPVHRSGLSKSKQVSGPDRPPPPGYVCYRCGEKGNVAPGLS